MLVVKTTSATAGRKESDSPLIRPLKRVPSSRRRNPRSVIRRSLANLALRSRSWRFRRRCSGGRRRRWRCGGRCWLERNSRRGCRRRHILRLGAEALLENGAGRGSVCRHQLQNEGKAEEYSAAPPTDCGEKISRLADSDQRIG